MKSKIVLVLPLLLLTGCGTTELKKTAVAASVLGRMATPSTAPSRSNFLRTIRTVEKGGITFNLLQCARRGQGEVLCKFSVISNRKDKTLGVRGAEDHGRFNSRAIASGMEYPATSASIGGSEKQRYVTRTLIANTRMEASVGFSDIPSHVNKLGALELGLGDASKVQFTNVVISN